jgi:hypothetical protein
VVDRKMSGWVGVCGLVGEGDRCVCVKICVRDERDV